MNTGTLSSVIIMFTEVVSKMGGGRSHLQVTKILSRANSF